MNGYCSPGKIYFAIGNKTAFAKYPEGFSEKYFAEIDNYEDLIESGSYQGSPPYKPLKEKLSVVHRQYHSAEHKVYNCFVQKIKKLESGAGLEQLRKKIPELHEVKSFSDFSPLCGTTILFFSGLSLILAALPNIFKFYNTNFLFMVFWLPASVLIASSISRLIQKNFFLAEPKDHQIVLAIKALKEALK